MKKLKAPEYMINQMKKSFVDFSSELPIVFLKYNKNSLNEKSMIIRDHCLWYDKEKEVFFYYGFECAKKPDGSLTDDYFVYVNKFMNMQEFELFAQENEFMDNIIKVAKKFKIAFLAKQLDEKIIKKSSSANKSSKI